MSNFPGLTEYLSHQQDRNAVVAHLPGVKEHISELVQWEEAVEAEKWKPISTLPDGSPDPCLVLFNPCDGVHPYLLTTPPRKHAQIKAGQWGYTHWRILSRPVTA